MGLFKKLGLPNAEQLDETVGQSMNPLQRNPITGAIRAAQVARAGKLARMPIPGETTVMLNPGKLRLTYQEKGNALRASSLYIAPRPPGLAVRLAGGGEPLPLKWIPPTAALSSGFTNKTTALLAEVKIPATGEYTISAPQPVPDTKVLGGTLKHEDTQLLLDA